MDKYAKQALDEYNSNTVTECNKKRFWNINSSQFMFVPSFIFPAIPGAEEYVFTAVDSEGKTHCFTAEAPTTALTPIWKDIAVGIVELKVEAINNTRKTKYLAGARTFYKTAPFPGREALPPRACSYKECAVKALRYVFNDPTTQYWLKYKKPDPDYYHNVYPSKMISGIVKAMLAYAEIETENAEKALTLAVNAAEYLISITYGEESALAGLPPTYSFKGLNKEIVDKNAPAADGRKDKVMMIYPAVVGNMYLQLEKATGDERYFKAAERIAQYYKNNVLPNGSWYLLVSEKNGKEESDNCCLSFGILEFLNEFYLRTKDDCWHELEDNYYKYIRRKCLENYNWEGQFEDIALSGNYLNLTHLQADRLITYIVEKLSDNAELLNEAEELMRFAEDQFVVWGKFASWNKNYVEGESYWYSPAALEQYFWYVPIDGSTGAIMKTFLDLYSVKHDELMLEKACALGDAITRMQDFNTGVIPTHWMWKDCTENLQNFWINCHISSAFNMMRLAKTVGEI